MSILIDKKDLTQDLKKQILTDLLISEQDWFASKLYQSPGKSWNFLEITEDKIKVPFSYGLKLGFQPKPKPKTKFNFKTKLWEIQEQCLQEVAKHLLEHRTTLLALGTGSGKTILSVKLSSIIGRITLVYNPIKTLQDQWASEFADNTDAVVWKPGDPSDPEKAQVIIVTKWDLEKVPENILQKIGLLVVDEFHMTYTEKSVPLLLKTNPEYVIACTATPEDDKKRDEMLRLMIGSHGVYHYPERDYKIVRVDTGFRVANIQGSHGTNWSAIESEICNNIPRNDLIVSIVRQVVSEHKIIILTKQKSQRDYLLKKIGEYGIRTDFLSDKKDNYSECQVLIMTIQKGGTGFDEKNKCQNFSGIRADVLILAASIKSRRLLIQVIGRLRCEQPTIFDLVDRNPICEGHWSRHRRVIYKKRSANIVEITSEDISNNSDQEVSYL